MHAEFTGDAQAGEGGVPRSAAGLDGAHVHPGERAGGLAETAKRAAPCGGDGLADTQGGDAILEVLESELGVHAGQTTDDGLITLEHVECNAACDYAPVVMVNWEFFDNQTPTSATELVASLRTGQNVTPTRGGPLCSFRQTSRALAGMDMGTPETGSRPGDPTLAGLRVAGELRMNAPGES